MCVMVNRHILNCTDLLQVSLSSGFDVRSILDVLCTAARLALRQQSEMGSGGSSSTQAPGQRHSLMPLGNKT